MAVNLSPVGGVAAQFFTSTGAVLTGGKLYTYAAGTTTPAVTYTSSNGLTAWTNPVVLDAAGRVPGSGEIWLTDGLIYKFVLKDSNDVLIATYDNITGINSNAVAYTNQQEIVTATAGQTVFNLGINYQPGTNSLSVFVDGVNQYGPGAQYSYVETDSNTVTFNAGLHVGAEVKFTTTQQQGAGAVDASQVTYDPPFTGSVATNVEAKLAQYVSVKDFGAVGDGATDDTAAMQAAVDYVSGTGQAVYFPAGTYVGSIDVQSGYVDVRLFGENRETTIIEAKDNSTATISVHWTAFRCQIENLSVKNTSGGNNGTHYGIHSLGSGSNNGATGLKLSNVLVDGYNINVKLDEFNDQTLKNCVFSNAVDGGGAAPAGANLYAGSPTYPCVGLVVDLVYCIGGKYGMYLENTEGIKVSQVDCVLSSAQGLIHQRTSGSTYGMVISDSYFDSTGLDAFYIEGVTFGAFTNLWCSSSTLTSTGNGIQLVDCANCMFSNVTAYGNKAAGLLLLQNCTYNSFSSCTFNGNATYGVNIPNSGNFFNIFNGCNSENNTVGALRFLDATASSPNYWLNSFASSPVVVQPKDIKQGGNSSGGVSFSLTYQKQDLPDGAANANLDFTLGQTIFVAPITGSLISISVALNDTRVAGTLYARPTVNGAAKDALRVQIDGTNTQYAYLSVSVGEVNVTAGDLIRVFYDTDASWDTTGGAGTVDVAATLLFITR